MGQDQLFGLGAATPYQPINIEADRKNRKACTGRHPELPAHNHSLNNSSLHRRGEMVAHGNIAATIGLC
jgi:hypothetical protein